MHTPRYTPSEADRALVLLRPVAEDIRQRYGVLRHELQARQHLDLLGEITSDASVPEPVRVQLLEIQSCLAELRELGAVLLDPEIGLVSLPGVLPDGAEVRLCWKLGETRVRFWFPVEGNYADRRPIPSAATA